MKRTRPTDGPREKRKGLLFRTLLLVFVLFLLAGAAVLWRKPSLRWRLENAVAGVFGFFDATEGLVPVTEEEEAALTLTPWTWEELCADSRVTVDQSLLLINGEHPMPEAFSADVAEYGDSGVWMNRCVMDAYRALAADVMERFDEKLYIMSAYRTESEQAAAMEEEGDAAAKVGESEHQAGLGLDVYVRYYAGAGFLDSPVGQYVNAHCQEYGFIIRYPSYGTAATGMGFEPWHLRYVGPPHAEVIAEKRLTLEEYMETLGQARSYFVGEAWVSRQEREPFSLPASFARAVVSPDNRGGYVLTVFGDFDA